MEAKTNTTSLFRFFLLKLPEGDELVWDDGTVNPEPCLDQFTLVSKVRQQHRYYLYLFFSPLKSQLTWFSPPPFSWLQNQALGMLLAGLGGYAALGYALTLRDKASQQPYVSTPFFSTSPLVFYGF